MNAIAIALLGSAIRHFASIAAGALVANGVMTANESSTVVGAVTIVGSVLWSQIDGWLKSQKLKLAKK